MRIVLQLLSMMCSFLKSNSLKYLGIVFVSGNKMTFDFKSSRSKFFRSFNSIISKISKANETVIVSLIKINCIPILMYGVEALGFEQINFYFLFCYFIKFFTFIG